MKNKTKSKRVAMTIQITPDVKERLKEMSLELEKALRKSTSGKIKVRSVTPGKIVEVLINRPNAQQYVQEELIGR
jgi:hypothetical protein